MVCRGGKEQSVVFGYRPLVMMQVIAAMHLNKCQCDTSSLGAHSLGLNKICPRVDVKE